MEFRLKHGVFLIIGMSLLFSFVYLVIISRNTSPILPTEISPKTRTKPETKKPKTAITPPKPSNNVQKKTPWPAPKGPIPFFPRNPKMQQFEKKNPKLFSHFPNPNKRHIFLMWAGASFPPFYQRCVETILYHHPEAQVFMYSNELPIWYFKDKGHPDVQVVRWDESAFFGIEKSIMTAVQKSEYLRLYVVYMFGGLYIDTDMVVLRNLFDTTNYIGANTVERSSYNCTDQPMKQNGMTIHCMCTCIFNFEQYHPFLGEALFKFYDYWSKDKKGYSPAGAVMWIKIAPRYIDHINFIDSADLFCYNKDHTLFGNKVGRDDDPKVVDIKSRCHSVHIFGGGNVSASIEIGDENNQDTSIIARLWRMNHKRTKL